MKGTNEIILSHETAVEAIQHYFDSVLFASGQSPKVEKVQPEGTKGYGDGNGLKITMSPKPALETPKP